MTDRIEPPMDAPPSMDGPSIDDDATRRLPSSLTSPANPAAPLAPTAPPAPTTAIAPTAPTVPLTPVSRASAPPPSFEHEVPWAAATAAVPVVRDTVPRPRRRSRLRWAISTAVIALVIASSAAVAMLVTGRSSTAVVLGYVPDDSILYGEVRLDLPGDQRRSVGAFLSHFPGFADQAALDSKLDEVLDDLIKAATKGDETYTANIKPWFDGELGFSMGPLPPAASLLNNSSSIRGFHGLALMSIKDPVAAQAWIDAAIAKSGATVTRETYDGANLTIFESSGGPKAAFALLDGKVAVAGDVDSVKAAVDTKGDSRFAAQAGPKAAIDAGTGDYVGFVYVGLRQLMDWSNDMSASLPAGGRLSLAVGEAMLKAIPDWGAYWLRIENDAVVMQAVAPKSETPLGPTENRASTIFEHVPVTAVVASSGNDYGKTLKQMIDLYRSDPAYKTLTDQFDQVLGLVGGADAAIGWAGDTAIVVNASDGTPEAGLVVAPTDKAAAARLFTSLRTFIAIGGAQQGLSVRDEDYNGTTVTIVDLGDIRSRTGLPAGTLTGPLPLPTGHIEIAYAVTDDVVVLGSGPGFVKHVLDTTKDTSLASNERYKKLADKLGTGTGTAFVDVTAIRGLIEKAAASADDPAALAKYEKDVKPFLAPFDALVASGSVDGDLNRSVIYLTVK